MGSQNEVIEYASARAVIEAVCRAEGIEIYVLSQPRGDVLQVGRCHKGFAVSIPVAPQWDDLTRTLGILAFLWDLSELGDLDDTAVDCPLPWLQDTIQSDIAVACREALEAHRAKAAA